MAGGGGGAVNNSNIPIPTPGTGQYNLTRGYTSSSHSLGYLVSPVSGVFVLMISTSLYTMTRLEK